MLEASGVWRELGMGLGGVGKEGTGQGRREIPKGSLTIPEEHVRRGSVGVSPSSQHSSLQWGPN